MKLFKYLFTINLFLVVGFNSFADPIDLIQLRKGAPLEIFGSMDCRFINGFIAGGSNISGKGIKATPILVKGQDNNISNIQGNLILLAKQFNDFMPLNSVLFFNENVGLVSVRQGMMGAAVYRTDNGGKTWNTVFNKLTIYAMTAFDQHSGIGVGRQGYVALFTNDGQDWKSINTNADVDLKCVAWSGKDLYAAGYMTSTDFNGQETLGKAVVIVSHDRGNTWEVVYQTSGVQLCPIFVIPDTTRVFVGGLTPNGDSAKAFILGSQDGKSFSDIDFPIKVGTVGPGPLYTSSLATMFFTKDGKGIVVGSAFISKKQSGPMGQSNEVSISKAVVYFTKDYGKTWWHKELGNFSPLSPPPDEGTLISGCFKDLATGWVAGSGGFIYRVYLGCQQDSDCPEGYHCSTDSRCINSSGNSGNYDNTSDTNSPDLNRHDASISSDADNTSNTTDSYNSYSDTSNNQSTDQYTNKDATHSSNNRESKASSGGCDQATNVHPFKKGLIVLIMMTLIGLFYLRKNLIHN